jgi:hypothetical protein
MAIVIGRRPEHGYTRVPNAWLRDPALSFKAKGLLAYLLSHRDGYPLTADDIIATFPEGKSAVYGMIRELEERGYLRRVQRRDERGTVGETDFHVADAPAEFPQVETDNRLSADGFSADGKPDSGDDQGKQGIVPGQTVDRLSVGGKPALYKKNRVLEEQENSLSAPGDDDPPAVADRERDDLPGKAPLERRLIAARGVPPDQAEPVRSWVEAQCGVRGPGWWIAADRNGTLDGWIAAAQAAVSAASRPPSANADAGPCGTHPWHRGGVCLACAGEANGREPAAVLPSMMSSGRVIRSAADQRVADGAVLYAKYAALDAAEAAGEGDPVRVPPL